MVTAATLRLRASIDRVPLFDAHIELEQREWDEARAELWHLFADCMASTGVRFPLAVFVEMTVEP